MKPNQLLHRFSRWTQVITCHIPEGRGGGGGGKGGASGGDGGGGGREERVAVRVEGGWGWEGRSEWR